MPECSPVRFALVAMPWSRRDRPSAALSALSAYLERERPDMEVVCRSEFVEVAYRIGIDLYDKVGYEAYSIGELLYTPLVYPEKTDALRSYFVEWAPKIGITADAGALFDQTVATLAAHAEAVAEELATGFTAVGFTTCFGQLFANLGVARAIKRRAPEVTVFLGGSTVSARVGPSLLAEYPFVDFIIQGEGERPLVGLADALVAGDAERAARTKGILSRASAAASPKGAELNEVPNMDDLPIPSFDEYAARAEAYGIDWHLPFEASRGCWWDRTRRTGDPKNTCYFCNLNVQWGGYREKSTARVVEELETLSDRYKNLKIYFLDNIIRNKGVVELAERIGALGKEFEIFYEMRANIRPHELVALWEAGLRTTQFGIEGLSTSFLRRIGKGTTMLKNLQVMRLCTELGIENLANIIVDFPGATAEEVAETCEAIESYALSFQPLSISSFHLGMGCTVDTLRERFGVTNVRNEDLYRHGMPDDVRQRLQLFDLSFDLAEPSVDWSPVRDARERWVALHRANPTPPRLLSYRDGGSFLVIEDERFGEFRSGTFEGVERDLYLYCMEIRSREEIERRFKGRLTATSLDEILGKFVEFKIVASEADRYLSLATASSPHLAARRIREALEQDRVFIRDQAPRRAPLSLPVLQ